MQTQKFLLIILVLAMAFLAACQSAATPTIAPAEAPAPVEDSGPIIPTEEQPAAEPAQPYPAQEETEAPAQAQAETSDPAYPGPEGAQTVEWSEVEGLLKSGEVIGIFQARSLQVTLLYADGSQKFTTEPEFNAVFELIEACGESCQGIAKNSE